MTIQVLGWSYENIRRFENLVVDLKQENSNPDHISLIMMRNGTGKTTTITLIKAVLSGSAVNWKASEVRKYRPVRGNPLKGKFSLQMRFNEEVYYFFLNLDYENGVATYQTSKAGRSGGLLDILDLPYELQGAFDNEEFVSRFIFDGEQAKKTLNADEKVAESAIINLYQINKLNDLQNNINELVSKKQESSNGTATPRGVSNYKTRATNRLNKLNSLKEKSERLEMQQGEVKSEIHRLEQKRNDFIASDEQLRKQHAQLQEEKEKNIIELNQSLLEMGRHFKFPYLVSDVFDKRYRKFADNLQELRLPKTTAKEFFTELSKQELCVCGRPIGEHEKEEILLNSEKYLGQEQFGVINAIKTKINEYDKNDSLRISYNKMLASKNKLQKVNSALVRLATNLDENTTKEIQEIDRQLAKLQKESAEVDLELEILYAKADDPRYNENNNLHKANTSYDEAQKKYLEATGMYAFTVKAQIIVDYIEEIKSEAIRKLKENIITLTNEKISKIFTDEPLMVDKIDGHLRIKDKSSVSEGQMLAIAYAYIGSLFEHSAFEFPFIVDSPAASMDLEVRREVAYTIPELFEQLVVFVTSGEVAGFAETFYERDDVLYVTIIGTSENRQENCVYGRNFFASYQSEEE